MKGPSFQGGRGTKGQPLLLRCLYCGEDWPDTPEFYRYWNERRIGRKCLACTAEARDRSQKAPLCPTCMVIRTDQSQCHGCAGRFLGPLTGQVLERYGLAPRREVAA